MSRPESGGPEPIVDPPEGVEIRPARPSDGRKWLRHIAEVASEGRYIRTEEVRWTLRQIRQRFRKPYTRDELNVVVLADDNLIGTLWVGRESNPVTAHVASLGMSVDRGWRSRGIGSALMSEAFRWARWAGIEKIALTVYPHNQRAINLYKKFGFFEEGRLTGHSKKSYGYEDEIVMGRWL
jgi:ribosomal protein S18 acetylase RimI-like enzyme